jgi:predicted nucleic acid-binding protein
MFLVDTNVLSEKRKGSKADPGVAAFIESREHELFLPVQVVGELRSGIEGLRRRGDLPQALRLEKWFELILKEYALRVLAFDVECAEIWGTLMGVNDQHTVDRQIAAIALVYDLTVVTRNISHFEGTGVRLLNPFLADLSTGKLPARRKPH